VRPTPIRFTRRGRYVFGSLAAGVLAILAFLPGRSATLVSGSFASTPAVDSAAVRVVAFGDSVASGYGCDCQSFVPMYAELIHHQNHRSAFWTNFAVAGAVSQDVLSQLNSATVAASVGRANTVLVMIGANDFAFPFSQIGSDPHAVERFASVGATLRANMTATVRRIHALAGPQARVVVLGYWNVLEGGRAAERDYNQVQQSAALVATRTANEALRSAALDAGAMFVSTVRAFYGPAADQDPTGLLADDGDHPNVAGHRAIAAALAAAVPPVP